MLEQHSPDHPRVEALDSQFAAAVSAGDLVAQQATYYGLSGLARELASEAATARSDADEALGMAMNAEAERDEARTEAAARVPRDESQELKELRARAEGLTGQLAAAQAALKDEQLGRRRDAESHAAALAQAAREKRAAERRLQRASGALAVAKQHVCSVDEVPHAIFAGVVGNNRVYVVNTLPGRQSSMAAVQQHRSGETLVLRVVPIERVGDEEFTSEEIPGDVTEKQAQ